MFTNKKLKGVASRCLLAVVMVAVCGLAAGQTTWTPPTVHGQGEICGYSPSPQATLDLWVDLGEPTQNFTNEEWRPSEVKTFSLTGPYVGPVTIWSTGSGTVTNTTTPNISCQQYQRYTIEKGSGNVPLYVKRCDAEEKTTIRFFIAHPYKCEPGQHVQKTFQFHIQDVVENQVQIIEPNHAEPIDTDETETSTDPTPTIQGPAPVYVPRKAVQLAADTPPCNMTGTLIPELAIRTAGASEEGPRHLKMAWTTTLDQLPDKFCIQIEHKFPGTIPDGVGNFPADGYDVSWSRSWLSGIRYYSHGAKIGGSEFAGMYPGGTYLVTIRALMYNGDFGPGKTIETTTNSHEQLGSVVAASAKEPYDFYPGYVKLQWQGAAGHPRFLEPSEGITVTIEWKKAGESYSPERMQEVQPNFGFQVIPGALYWGQPRIWYSSSVILETDTTYTFRLIPKQPNFGDGLPVEITYRTKP